MVSMIAVKIQCNSPRTVLRSVWRPGIFSTREWSIESRNNEREQNLCEETLPFSKNKLQLLQTQKQLRHKEYLVLAILKRLEI